MAGFSGLRSNRICFVSGCSALLGFCSFSSLAFCILGSYCILFTLYGDEGQDGLFIL